MHIQRISSIKNYRIFQDFKAVAAAQPWQPVTVVYGSNGSGKSTLSSLFAELASGTASGTGISVELFRRQNVVQSISETDAVWSNLRVFNQDYVRDNLDFETAIDGSGVSAKHLLTLGGDRIKIEKRLKQIKSRQAEITEKLTEHGDSLRAVTKKRDAIPTNLAQNISRELGHVDTRFNPRSYKAPKVREQIEKGKPMLTSAASVDSAHDEKQVKSRVLPPLVWTSGAKENVSDLVTRINTLRATTVVSRVIDELSANKQAADWVQDGLTLHKPGQSCFFCTGEITVDRRAALESHFDESLLALQTEAKSLRSQILAARSKVTDTIESVPKKTEFYAAFHEKYDEAVTLAKARKKAFLAGLALLEQAIDEKEAAPFSALDPISPPQQDEFAVAEVDAVVTSSDSQTATFGDTIVKAALGLEATRILQYFDDYACAAADVKAESTAISTLQGEATALKEEEETLSAADLDPLPKAKRLNRDLALLLGRNEISFQSVGEQYEIMRGDRPATGLSEGERNAISLLYFLCALERHEDQGKDLIVVIDDPVSSFDDNIMYGASAHLWSRLVESELCHQLIVFTHSYNLFRTWSNQLDRRFKKEKTKKPHAIKELSASLQKSKDGTFRRQPQFLDWPEDGDLRTRLRSEYHYLFWTLGTTLTNASQATDPLAQSAAATIMPNAARRLLESFLAFKSPATMGNFEASVTAAMGDMDEALRLRMIKFLHRFSHNEQGDIDAHIRPEEALPVLASVFSLINSRDEQHFDETCASLELDASLLLQLATVNEAPEEEEPLLNSKIEP